MSAWYIWSSMGMYAVNPVDAIYAIGSYVCYVNSQHE
jgi:putative alpha-1,2-mannosidase